jgi:hypothetical protein
VLCTAVWPCAEYDPYASQLFISALSCSLVGHGLELRFEPGSLVSSDYGAVTATERHYCNFGVAPGLSPTLEPEHDARERL